MDFHKLLYLISTEFLDSTRGITYAAWLDNYEGHWQISEDDYLRARCMLLLKDRKTQHKPLEVGNTKDSLCIIYNWSLVWAGKLNVSISYERFIEFVTRYNFKSITRIPNYQESLRMAFEYVYQYVERAGFNEDDIITPNRTQISFVKSWIANKLMETSIHTADELYTHFLKRCGYPADELGVDPFFTECFTDVETTLAM